ncbi:MAG: DUF2510 domain-containing protein [Actinomycetota bacterium]|nr:DUF2510 domain-containing protein [Actinomycetota bacterium]
MAARTHPPAWYPDPKDPDRVRRWDGRAWTGDVRPLPEWLRTLQLSAGPAGKSPHSSRLLWAVSAGLLGVGALLMVILSSGGDDESRIHDKAFVREANRRCARAEQEVVRPNGGRRKGAADAVRVETLAGGWEQMVSDLRRLEVAPRDQAKVDQWFRAWDRLTELGRQYATAIAAEDSTAAQRVLERTVEPKQDISRFAYVNGVNSCIFRT